MGSIAVYQLNGYEVATSSVFACCFSKQTYTHRRKAPTRRRMFPFLYQKCLSHYGSLDCHHSKLEKIWRMGREQVTRDSEKVESLVTQKYESFMQRSYLESENQCLRFVMTATSYLLSQHIKPLALNVEVLWATR